MEQQQQEQTECRFGTRCKFLKKNSCKNYHPKEHYEQAQQNQQQNVKRYQKKHENQYQQQQQRQFYKKRGQNGEFDQEEIEQEDEEEQKEETHHGIKYNEHQKKPNQSLKDFYQQMLMKNEQITCKAKQIESLQPGFSMQQDEQREYLYELSVQKAVDLQNESQIVRIGIDFGNVICGSDPSVSADQKSSEDTMFGPNYLNTPMIPRAFEVIKMLVQKFGEENIFIVSKCGENVQKKTQEWMSHKNIFGETGLLQKNIFFCRERKEKAGICYENSINFFIDDKFDVLQNMDNRIITFLFPDSKQKKHPNRQNMVKVPLDGWSYLIDVFQKIKKI